MNPTESPLYTALAAVLPERLLDVDLSRREAYSHDSWPVSTVLGKLGEHLYTPDVVVHVESTADVLAVLAVAQDLAVAVTPWGLGSSVTGQPLAREGGIMLDMGRLVTEPVLDTVDNTVTVGAGHRGSELEEWLNQRGHTLNHFPQSLGRSSVGGWLATRATGQLSSKYGGIEDLVVRYEVVLTDGSVLDVHARPRAAVGPDLRALFLGSEGCFGVITEVTLKVFPLAPHRRLGAFSMPSVAAGLEAMRTIAQASLRPMLVRFYDEAETAHAAPGMEGCALFLGCDGFEAVAEAEFEECARIVRELGGRLVGPEPVEAWLGRRFDFSTVEKILASPGGYAETIEVAHLWSGIDELYTALTEALAPLADEVIAHFSHVYPQGTSLYVILLGHADSDEEARQRLAEIWRTAMKATVDVGGELSHHHGAGLARQEFIPEGLGEQHLLLRRLKEMLDPGFVLNPGKLGIEESPRRIAG
jgi:alkyldihydroxyacetonephosphate synthase